MRRATSLTVCGLLVLTALAMAGMASPPENPGQAWVEFSVGLAGSPSQAPGENFHGGQVVAVNHDIRFLAVKTQNPQGFLQAASNNPNVRYVEETPAATLHFTPNDPHFGNQWGLHDVPGISAEAAWDVTLGSTAVKVAVLDTGIQESHPDIGNIGTSRNVRDNNNNIADCDGHGTHTAGTVGALTNNGIGVAGVAQTTIMVVKVFGGSNCSGNFNDVANGITWAVNNGADVISMSLGCSQNNCWHTATADALDYAAANGVLSICSAGNSGPGGNSVRFPATHSECMAISASTSSGNIWHWSSRGSQVELIAPGASILSTYPGGYATLSGTSMAAPHVAGTAALAIAALDIRGANLRDHLKATAVDLGLAASQQGAGAVNAANAVGGTPPDPDPPEPDPPEPDPPEEGDLHTHDITLWRQGPHLRTRVWSYDASENPVSGVTVSAEICRSDGTCVTRSGDTNGDGTVQLNWQHAGAGTYTTCVTNMAKAGYTWNQAAGHATDGNCHTASV